MRAHGNTILFLGWTIMLFLIGSFVPARGQIVQLNQVALVQAQNQHLVQDTTPSASVTSDAVPTSPNDADLGEQQILKPAETYPAFNFLINTPVFFTSNVALTNFGQVGDVVVAPMAAAFYDPAITRTLYAHIGAQEQVFYYGTYTSFNFASLDCQAGLTYFVPSLHNLMLRAWYDFNRLTLDDSLGDEFFSNHQILLDAEIPFHIDRAQQVSLGVDANLSVAADHQSPRRNDYEGYFVYSASLTRALSMQVSGRIVARDYHQNGRTDISEIFSASATCWVTHWGAISAISSFARSDSNQSVFDYSVANLGGALELSVKF